MTDVAVLHPGGKLAWTFDFTLEAPDPVTVTSVAYTVPPPLATFQISHDLANKKSTVGLEGAVHGGTYQVVAKATLSNNEQVAKTLTVRGFQG